MINSIQKFTRVICLCIISSQLHAQNIGINSDGSAPVASAMLDIVATDKGLLIPRVALTATNASGPVTSPATSLLVYNTATAGTAPNNVVPGYYYWNGSAWIALLTASNTAWTLTGNTATTAGTNFIGTTDAVDFVVKTNNTERARVSSSGNVGIGTSTFDVTNPEKLLVNTANINAIVGKGNIDSYVQLNIKNQSAGTNASSDVVATANNGTETTFYVDMGINSSGNASGVMGGANDAYLYNIGQNFLLGTGTAAKSLVFMTGGTSQATNERMRIDGSGLVGVGNNSPSFKLDVNGAIRTGKASSTTGSLVFSNSTNANTVTFNSGVTSSSYSLTLPTAQGAASTVLTNDGAGVLSWSTGAPWTLDGNNITGTAKTLGTTSNKDLPIITNNIERMRINTAGQVGIGTSTFNSGPNAEQLLVNTTTINAIVGKGNIDSYVQLNIKNQSAGASASSDVVATADNGSETTNYVDMGINSSGYSTTGVLGGANNAYLYSAGNDFVIGNATANKNLHFFTGGTATSNERMTIDGSGNVGIGTTTVNSKLDVSGSVGHAITTTSSNLTLDATHYTVVVTSGTPTITLPAAAGNSRRMYVIVNQTGSGTTISSYLDFSGAGTTTVGANSSITIQSNGSSWYRIH